jgi:serine-type D-Ala-D-Ala carboxypeptidase (penicillin-binding protein 5/6)
MTLRRLIAGPLAALAALLAGAPPAAAQADQPSVGAPAAIVIDAKTGERLYAKNPGDERAIASTTKLMTALLTLERAKPGEVFTMPPYASSPAESKLGLQTGERMTVKDLLRAAMLPSANDAAYDLAVNIGGSEDEFVELMNERAASLGLDDTHYSTPVGLDDPGNYSSARDLAELTRRLLRNRTFARVVDMESAQLDSGLMPRTVVSRNTLVLEYPWVSGVKTGHTLQAGYVLVGSATARGASVVSVVLGTPSEAARDADSLELLKWGLGQFRRVSAVVGDREYATADVKWHDGEQVELVAERDVRLTTREGQRVERRVNAPTELEGPLATGTRVGELDVVYRDRVVKTVPLVTASPVQGAGLLRKAVSSVGGPGAAVALLALLGAIVILALRIRASRGIRERERARR